MNPIFNGPNPSYIDISTNGILLFDNKLEGVAVKFDKVVKSWINWSLFSEKYKPEVIFVGDIIENNEKKLKKGGLDVSNIIRESVYLKPVNYTFPIVPYDYNQCDIDVYAHQSILPPYTEFHKITKNVYFTKNGGTLNKITNKAELIEALKAYKINPNFALNVHLVTGYDVILRAKVELDEKGNIIKGYPILDAIHSIAMATSTQYPFGERITLPFYDIDNLITMENKDNYLLIKQNTTTRYRNDKTKNIFNFLEYVNPNIKIEYEYLNDIKISNNHVKFAKFTDLVNGIKIFKNNGIKLKKFTVMEKIDRESNYVQTGIKIFDQEFI